MAKSGGLASASNEVRSEGAIGQQRRRVERVNGEG